MLIRRGKKAKEDEVRRHLAEVSSRVDRPTADEVAHMTRIATSTPRPAEARQRGPSPRSVGVLVGLVALLVFASPLLAAVYDRLNEVADETGVREAPPESPAPGYRPAAEPYISVQPLMRYAGVDEPVIPRAAIRRRAGEQVVFTIATPYYTGTDQYEQLTIRANAVTLGEALGRAVVVTSGLDPCDKVLVDPSEDLQDGDVIRSYSQRSDGEVEIDYATLFAGRPSAPPPPVEGGIAHQDEGQVVLAVYSNGLTPPEGSTYEVVAPDGSVHQAAYARPAEVRVPSHVLESGRPVGRARLVSPAGETIASGLLEWYCLP